MTTPAVFADLDFTAGKARASAEDKLLLVFAISPTSEVAGIMDATWQDNALVDVLAAEFVALQLDVDQQPELARRLVVRTTPTTLVFRGGKEVGRIVGPPTAEQLGAWLDRFHNGAAVARARAAVLANPDVVGARIELARRLFHAGSFDGAADELAWAWARDSAAAREFPANFLLRALLQTNTPARQRFELFRTRVDPRDDVQPDPASLADWMCLNQAFADDDATLAWFDRMRDQIDVRGPLAPVLQAQIVPLLIEQGRWVDAGQLLSDPMSRLELALRQSARGDVGDIVRSLCAAGRDEDAAEVIERACSFDPSPEMDDVIAEALPERVLAAARAAAL